MKYRKTALIEAFQWFDDRPMTWPQWAMDANLKTISETQSDGAVKNRLMVDTLEGMLFARPGDWIARGVHGEIWPIKPDIFAESYEAVEG